MRRRTARRGLFVDGARFGFANSVAESQWSLFKTRNARAKAMLSEAGAALQAHDEGWDISRFCATPSSTPIVSPSSPPPFKDQPSDQEAFGVISFMDMGIWYKESVPGMSLVRDPQKREALG